MTTYLVSAGVLALLVLAVTSVVGGRQMRRVLREFDAAPGAELVPVALPPVSTLPEVDEDGWSARAGFNAWRAWLDAKHAAVFDAEPSIFTQLRARYLTEPQRELPAAPKRRTRRPKTTIGATTS